METVMAVLFICTLPLQVSSNLYNPHVFPENGPFFEGWYLRLQDPSKDFKMAVLFGTVLPQKPESSTYEDVPDRLAFVGALKCQGSGKLESYSTFPKVADVQITTANGHPIIKDPDWTTPPDFIWNATTSSDPTGYFKSSSNLTVVDFRVGSVHVNVQLGNPVPWAMNGRGPAGGLDALNLPLHWFVYSLATPVLQYSWQDSSTGQQFQGNSGWAHQEKNWGKNFPEAWIWTQGMAEEASRIFALSYGPVSFGSLDIPGHLFGYRNYKQGIDINLTPLNSIRSSKEYGCLGMVDITITSLTHRVRLHIAENITSFSNCLYGPTATGFRPVAVESYSSRATIIVEKRNIFSSWKTMDKFTFTGAALEFGGSYMCPQTCT